LYQVFLFVLEEVVIVRGNKSDRAAVKSELKKALSSIQKEEHTIQKVSAKDVYRTERDDGKIEKIEKNTQ